MNAPLLVALADHLVARGWAVLRFNFRGIGASEGTSGMGLEEVADARGALAATAARYDLPVAAAGWSFGGAVAIRAAAATPDLAGCVAIAPSVDEKPGITAGLPPPDELPIDAPLLIVCGKNDDQVAPDAVRAWATGAGARYVEMPGANHFFWAKYDDLAETVSDFLAEATSRPGLVE
jgi:alpha/beta superfamily hydrolase